MAGPIYLDDLAVGQKYETANARVTLEDATAFARQFDPQPFHLDETAGSTSVFGRLATSGWYTASLSMRLLVEGELDIAGGLLGLGGEIKWPRPTFPGDTLRVVSEVLAIRVSDSKPDRGIVTVRNQTLNQNDEAVQIFVVKMMVPRRPE